MSINENLYKLIEKEMGNQTSALTPKKKERKLNNQMTCGFYEYCTLDLK